MRDILFHHVRASFGWGKQISRLDVSRIEDMQVFPRLFRIYQRNLPYTLRIEYYKPETNTGIAPVFGKGGAGISVYEQTTTVHIITYRYASQHDAEHELRKLQKKQQDLENMKKLFLNLAKTPPKT